MHQVLGVRVDHLWVKRFLLTSSFSESKAMGYLISFLLGIFVATVGVSGAASVLDKAVKQTQVYMKESVK
jgi:hypothetical protein